MTAVRLPDVQAYAAPHPYALTRVGVRGVRKPVTVRRPGQKPHGVTAVFDLFVDLPSHQKGTHMSRNLEALADVLDQEVVGRETGGLENLCARLVTILLERHDYADDAEVACDADYFLVRKNPGGKPTVESYRILAWAGGRRGEPVRRRIGVDVVGMTACPCAMETARAKLDPTGKVPAHLPFITHNQRNRVRLQVDVPEGQDVEAEELVDLAESALSAPTYELLKRGDEGDLVIRAHGQPRFVEDVVREALAAVARHFPRFPAATEVFVSSEAEESIHKHNAYAERRTALGSLLKGVDRPRDDKPARSRRTAGTAPKQGGPQRSGTSPRAAQGPLKRRPA